MAENAQQLTTAAKGGTPAKPVMCEFCSGGFPSRNAMFRHLKSPGSCGGVESTGPEVAVAPSPKSTSQAPSKPIVKKPKAPKSKKSGKRNTAAAFTSHVSQEVWLGEIPYAHSLMKPFNKLLWDNVPTDMPHFEIKTLVRKGYRNKDKATKTKEWRGFAILAFPSANDATKAIELFNNITVTTSADPPETFQLRANPAEAPKRRRVVDTPSNKETPSPDSKTNSGVGFQPAPDGYDGSGEGRGCEVLQLPAGQDPPLVQQLAPLGKQELLERLALLTNQHQPSPSSIQKQQPNTSNSADSSMGGGDNLVVPSYSEGDSVAQLRACLCAAYECCNGGEGRTHTRVQPDPATKVPAHLLAELLAALDGTEWPVKRHRPKVQADHYLVLTRSKPREAHERLTAGLEALMAWAAPGWPFTHVAVTKNFTGSPHIDTRDTSHQFALSLGRFQAGGEVCVESEEEGGGRVWVVTTRDHLVRFDGRYIHWVRSHEGGDRYSLIFFHTILEGEEGGAATPRERSLHADWRPPSPQ